VAGPGKVHQASSGLAGQEGAIVQIYEVSTARSWVPTRRIQMTQGGAGDFTQAAIGPLWVSWTESGTNGPLWMSEGTALRCHCAGLLRFQKRVTAM
jgi:hypothetical protein